MTHHRERTTPHLAVIPIAGGTEGVTGPVVRLCGMPVIERLLRTLRAVGLWDVVVVAGDAEQERLQRTLKGVERLGLRVDVADLKGHVPNLGLAPDQRVLVVEGNNGLGVGQRLQSPSPSSIYPLA